MRRGADYLGRDSLGLWQAKWATKEKMHLLYVGFQKKK